MKKQSHHFNFYAALSILHSSIKPIGVKKSKLILEVIQSSLVTDPILFVTI